MIQLLSKTELDRDLHICWTARHARTAIGPRTAQLGGKFTMQAPAHLQPKVVIGSPSRKRSCPEPDDFMAFAVESSDSS